MTILLATGFQGGAVADELTPTPSSLIDAALDDVNAPDAQANEALDVPKNAEDTVDYNDAKLSFGLDIPASGRPATDELRTTFAGDGQDNSISLEPLDNGMRALITIDSPDAPTSYAFDISGDVADLSLESDGSVLGLDSNANPIVTIPAPWAVDANGATVPTHYEVNGTVLTQLVEHTDGEWAYGITADPSFLWWAGHIVLCVGEVGSWLVPGKIAAIGAKLTKLAKSSSAASKARKAIDELGGLKKASKAVATFAKHKGGGLSKANKARVKNIFKSGKSIVKDVLGIGSCYQIFQELK